MKKTYVVPSLEVETFSFTDIFSYCPHHQMWKFPIFFLPWQDTH